MGEVVKLLTSSSISNAKGTFKRTYDKYLKGFVYKLDVNNKLRFPKIKTLSLSHSILTLQLLIPQAKDFSFEVYLTDINGVLYVTNIE